MGKIFRAGVVLACMLLIAATCVCQAQQDGTIVLQQGIDGYTGCADTYLRSSTGEDVKNFGIDNDPSDWTKYRDIKVRNYSSNQWVTLIRFDLSSLPKNWSITSASLSLYYYDDYYMESGDYLKVAIYPLLKQWDEGVGDHSGDDRSGAAWFYTKARPSTEQWYNAGARGAGHDRDSAFDAEVQIYGNAFGWVTWSGTEVTNTVRDWYNGSRTNNGWQMDFTASNDTNNAVIFHSSNYSIVPADYIWRPKLTISYTVIPEPGSLLVLASGFLGLAATRRRRAA